LPLSVTPGLYARFGDFDLLGLLLSGLILTFVTRKRHLPVNEIELSLQ
jgi:hypothetical protein